MMDTQKDFFRVSYDVKIWQSYFGSSCHCLLQKSIEEPKNCSRALHNSVFFDGLDLGKMICRDDVVTASDWLRRSSPETFWMSIKI